ncbi:MAG: hypothetical protein GEU74_12430 [Nitriliruptorales bacterium]|nr:hypothetical protein [Nitriliruptorales bacterium]
MRRLNGEEGSYAIVVGVLFMALVAVLAMTVDGGILNNEREELQNGADAAALAVAYSCARGACDATLADEYAVANASGDEATTVEDIDIDMGTQTVTVITRTQDTPMQAAKVFGEETALVRARGRARWGAIGAAATAPFVISQCDIDAGVAAQGGDLYETAPAGTGIVIPFHDSTQADDSLVPACPSHVGMDSDGDGFLPGGFGKIQVEEDCTVHTSVEEDPDGTTTTWATVITGVAMPPEYKCLELGPMAIPVFGDYRIQPGHDEYRIINYIGFHVTGWSFPGYSVNAPDCKAALADQLGVPEGSITGQAYCVSGWFVDYAITDSVFCTNPALCPFGVTTARMTY